MIFSDVPSFSPEIHTRVFPSLFFVLISLIRSSSVLLIFSKTRVLVSLIFLYCFVFYEFLFLLSFLCLFFLHTLGLTSSSFSFSFFKVEIQVTNLEFFLFSNNIQWYQFPSHCCFSCIPYILMCCVFLFNQFKIFSVFPCGYLCDS